LDGALPLRAVLNRIPRRRRIVRAVIPTIIKRLLRLDRPKLCFGCGLICREALNFDAADLEIPMRKNVFLRAPRESLRNADVEETARSVVVPI
jgi:hypothetical protein